MAYLWVAEGVQCPGQITSSFCVCISFCTQTVLHCDLFSLMMLIAFANSASFIPVGLLTGGRRLQNRCWFYCSALEKILSRNGSAVLYVCPKVYKFAGSRVFIDMILITFAFPLCRWHMVGQILVFIVVLTLVQMSTITSLILLPMIMWERLI